MIKKYIKKIVKEAIDTKWIYIPHDLNRSIKDNIGEVRNQIIIEDITKEIFKNLIECEKCGYMLKKETAIRGNSVIKTTLSIYADVPPQETIHTPYYCKVHAPKAKK